MQRGPVVLDIQAVVAFHPAAGVGVWEIATGSHGREDRGRRQVRGHRMPAWLHHREEHERTGVDRMWEKAKEDTMGGESPSS